VQRYGLAEPCDDIEPVLRHVALAQGRMQKVKVLTGTGECFGGGSSATWGTGARLWGILGWLQALLIPPSAPTTQGTST